MEGGGLVPFFLSGVGERADVALGGRRGGKNVES